jgi:hypothetical protein
MTSPLAPLQLRLAEGREQRTKPDEVILIGDLSVL